jgi:hypothetical protein
MARIANFLEQYAKPATRSGYRSAVLAFLSFIYGGRIGTMKRT